MHSKYLDNNFYAVFFLSLQTLMYLRLFAHILVGFLIGALYYDIGNDGGKVLSNLGFLFFNMLFLMYTSMTITILSCKQLTFAHFRSCSSSFHYIDVVFIHFSPFGNAGAVKGELQSLVLAKIVLFSNYCFRYTIPGEFRTRI